MAQMRFALGAMHFGPAHPQTIVGRFPDFGACGRLVEGRPAGATVKLVGLIKKRRVTTDAMEHSVRFGEVVMRECAFGAMLSRDLEGKVGQLAFPLCVGFRNLTHFALRLFGDILPSEGGGQAAFAQGPGPSREGRRG